MKVAFVNQPFDMVFPPDQNSLGIWSFEVGMRLSGVFDVVVYSRGPEGSQPASGHDGKIVFKNIPIVFDSILLRVALRFFSRARKKIPLYGDDFYYFFYALMVALDLRRQRCDVVHVYNYSQFVPIIKFFNPRSRVILNMHCEWLSQLDRDVMSKRIARASHVMGVSDHITSKIKERFPEHASRCSTVYNGIDPDVFQIKKNCPPRDRTILFVGRISPEKGLHVLIEAFRSVHRQCPDTRLLITGPRDQLPDDMLRTLCEDPVCRGLCMFCNKDYHEYLRDMVNSYGLAGNVEFREGVPFSRIHECYGEGCILVNPSFSESFGRSLIEAMSCGIPVVASRIGGMKEIIEEGRNGIFVDPGSVEGIAGALLYLLLNEDVYCSMARSGRVRVEECFTWDSVTRRYTEICELC